MNVLPNRIDAGYCIQNPGPNDRGYCDCYKYPVPYTLFGNDGVIMFCRGWIDYLMAYSDFLEQMDQVRKRIIILLKEKYPLLNADGIIISKWGSVRDGNLEGINLAVTPNPFSLEISFMPSFYLKHLHPRLLESPINYFPVYDEIPSGLLDKLRKTMSVIKYENRKKLMDYGYIHNRKTIAKRHHVIMDELLTKIKQYETA